MRIFEDLLLTFLRDRQTSRALATRLTHLMGSRPSWHSQMTRTRQPARLRASVFALSRASFPSNLSFQNLL